MICGLVVFSVLWSVALGCSPMGGNEDPNVEIDPFALVNAVRFELLFAPPVEWTTAEVPETALGQSPNAEAAKAATKAAFEVAMNAAFKEINAVMPNKVNYDFNRVVPFPVKLATTDKPNANEGVVELGVVSGICHPKGERTTCENGLNVDQLRLNQTVALWDGPYLSGTQWGAVATRLFSQLSAVDKVHFYQEIKVLKNDFVN